MWGFDYLSLLYVKHARELKRFIWSRRDCHRWVCGSGFLTFSVFYPFSAGLWGHLLLTWGEPCSGVLSKLRLPVAKTFGSLFAFSCRGLFFFWTWCSSCASTRLQKQSLLMQTFMFSDVTIFIICIRGYYSYSEVLTAGRSDPTLASYQTLHYGVTYIL